jgi:hypothetical protein
MSSKALQLKRVATFNVPKTAPRGRQRVLDVFSRAKSPRRSRQKVPSPEKNKFPESLKYFAVSTLSVIAG